MERILAHMNKDHKLSLFDYLVHYGGIDESQVSDVTMTHLQLDSFLLTFDSKSEATNSNKKGSDDSGTSVKIPIEPPMESMGDARRVLVEMAKTSAEARGFSAYRVTKYQPPVGTPGEIFGLGLFAFMGSLALFPGLVLGALRPYIVKLSPVLYQLLWERPWGPLVTTLVIHVVEYLFLFRGLLAKYRVPQPAKLYWILTQSVEGAFGINRFKREAYKAEH